MTRPTDKNRRNLYIKQEDYDYLAQIGNGNASKGIREAVKIAKSVKRDNPSQRAGAMLEGVVEGASGAGTPIGE